MNKKLLRKKLALMLATLKKKRPYRCEVEYLESTGTQYINTGLLSTANSKVDCVFGFTSMESGAANIAAVFGGRSATNSNTFTLFKISSSTPQFFRFDYNGQISVATANQMAWDTTSKYRFEYTGIQAIATNLTSGESVMTTRAPGSSFTPAPICLFCVNYSSSPSTFNPTQFMSGRIYKYWYTDGINTIDLIPVLDWNMTPCMYDKVSEKLFYNQGTGSFIAGRQIHPVEYLESTGTQYIDTGFKVDDTCGYYLDVQALDRVDSIDLGVKGTNSNSRWCFNSATTGFGLSWNTVYGAAAIDSNRHTAKMNFLNDRKRYLDDVEREPITTTLDSTAGTYTVCMFGAHWGSNSVYLLGSARIFACKISQGNSIVRDFIPAIDQNGVGFMFDRVTHSIFDNAGVGAFNYPPVEVEYLESTGTQYIDTGITGNSNTKVEVKCYSENTSQNRALFGARDGGDYLHSFTIWQVANNKIRFDYSADVSAVRTTIDWDPAIAHTIVKDGAKNYVDGVEVTSNNPVTFDCNFPFSLFGVNTGGSAQTGTLLIGRVYYCKVWNNNTLAGNFIPVFYNGQAGMWDKVNSVFYANAGTNAFVAGAIVEPEYE